MTDKQDEELLKELEKIDWPKYLDHGSVKTQIRFGKLTLLTVERTYKSD